MGIPNTLSSSQNSLQGTSTAFLDILLSFLVRKLTDLSGNAHPHAAELCRRRYIPNHAPLADKQNEEKDFETKSTNLLSSKRSTFIQEQIASSSTEKKLKAWQSEATND